MTSSRELRLVEQQFLFNLACHEVLRFVFHSPGNYRPNDSLRPIRDKIEVIRQKIGKLAPVVEFSIAAFDILYGDRSTRLLDHFYEQFTTAKEAELPIDRFLAEAIMSALQIQIVESDPDLFVERDPDLSSENPEIEID